MAKKMNNAEKRVIETVRKSSKPLETADVLQKLGDNSSVGNAIISLIDQGKLQVTLDLKLESTD